MVACVVEDQSLGVHARVMGEDAGIERGRVVRFEPRGLIGRQCERGRVRLAKSERGEGPQHIPDAFDCRQVIAATQGCRIEPDSHLVLTIDASHRAPGLIGLSERAAGHGRHDPQNLFVEDDYTEGFFQRRTQVVVQVRGCIPPLSGPQEWVDHVGLHRAGTKQRNINDEITERLRSELADEFPLPG